MLCGLLVMLFIAIPAVAQTDVTIREINTIPQGNLDELLALGAGATAEQIHAALTNEWVDVLVRVEAIVLTDPHYSGLASWNDGINAPGRIHYFIRDVAAETDGFEAMTIQVVDGTQTAQALAPQVGDVIELEGYVRAFGNAPQRTWQLEPIADGLQILDPNAYDSDHPLLQPIPVTSDDVNIVVDEVGGEPVVQANWANFSNLHSEYVRLEGAIVTNSQQAERPNWAITSVGGEGGRIPSYDLSLRYRNDRAGVYPNPPFHTRPADDPFLAPTPGAVLNVQGFLTFGQFDAFTIGLPPRAMFSIAPITDEDLVITASPPIITVEALDGVPDGPIHISANVVSLEGYPITDVTLYYEFTDGTEGSIGMTFAGNDIFEGEIPVTGGQDGEFVSYSVSATDGEGATGQSPTFNTRILVDGITELAHIQETASGGMGASPFVNMTVPMNLEVVVQTRPGQSGLIAVQDGTDPWNGIFLAPSEELYALLELGTTMTITEATIEEYFNLTQLVLSTGGYTVGGTTDPYPYVLLTTDQFASSNAFAESYEGMAIRFENVIISDPNPDDPNQFGEFAFSSDGTVENQLRARTGVAQSSSMLPQGHTIFEGGEELGWIQGILSYTHSNFKLLPEVGNDIDFKVSNEPGVNVLQTGIDALYPNPLTGVGTLNYVLGTDSNVSITVFDVMGRRVAVLADGDQAAGEHAVNVDASGFASGMYIVRLATPNTVQTVKFVVAR